MKIVAAFILLLISLTASAVVPSWQIIPTESSITFTATQNSAPVSGKFKVFTGEINADAKQLASSNVHIVIETDSVSTNYALVGDTLKTTDWLDTKKFPQAVFEANQLSQTGPNKYQAKGKLTLRGITLPLVLNFDAEFSQQNRAIVTGSTVIKRTAFGVGQGDWSKTNEIKDDIKINFVITAMRK